MAWMVYRVLFLLVLLVCVAAGCHGNAGPWEGLKKGYWRDSKYLYNAEMGDTLILSKSRNHRWKFKKNGNIKGRDGVLFCGNTSRVERWLFNMRRWEKHGTWNSERTAEGDFLHIDLNTRKMKFRYISTDEHGIVVVATEVLRDPLLEQTPVDGP